MTGDLPKNASSDGEVPVLEFSELVKVLPVRRAKGLRVTKRLVQAVSDVSFTIEQRPTLGLVGESGSRSRRSAAACCS